MTDMVPVYRRCNVESKAEVTRAESGRVTVKRAVLATEHRDRAGDIVRVAGIDTSNFKRNPRILFAHGFTSAPNPVVGSATNVYTGALEDGVPALFLDFAFSDKSDLSREVAAMWADGDLNSMSIGFVPVEWNHIDANGQPTDQWGGESGRDFTRSEMLEGSVVPIPMNPEARARVLNSEVIRRAMSPRDAACESEIDPAAASALLRTLSLEQCPGCSRPGEPRVVLYDRRSHRCLGHQDAGGSWCRGGEVTERGLTLSRIVSLLGPSLGHDEAVVREELLAAGTATLPVEMALAQLRTRVEMVVREGRVLSAKNVRIIREAIEALEAARTALEGALDAAFPPDDEKGTQAPVLAPDLAAEFAALLAGAASELRSRR